MTYNPFGFKDAKGNLIQGRSPEAATVPAFNVVKPRESMGVGLTQSSRSYDNPFIPSWVPKEPVAKPTPTPPTNFLGEVPVDVASHPVYSKYTPSDWALLYNHMYGGIDGDHHKAWVLDQMTRLLNGTPVIVTLAKWSDGQEEYRFITGVPSAAYLAWVQRQLGELDSDGNYEYSHDVGIAP